MTVESSFPIFYIVRVMYRNGLFSPCPGQLFLCPSRLIPFAQIKRWPFYALPISNDPYLKVVLVSDSPTFFGSMPGINQSLCKNTFPLSSPLNLLPLTLNLSALLFDIYTHNCIDFSKVINQGLAINIGFAISLMLITISD